MAGSTQVSSRVTLPETQRLSVSDIADALGAGWRDFLSAPLYGLFFGGVFTAGGLLAVLLLSWYGAPWMIIPIAIGFPLIGPFAAAGLYEVSRRLESGAPLSWRAVLLTVFAQRERQLGWMAFVVLFVFWVWVYQVRLLLALFMGFRTPSTLGGFVEAVTTTPEGMAFLAVGTTVGAVLALILFSITVLAMPLLLDTERDFVTAMIISVKGVLANPLIMLGWGLVVTVLAVLAMLPAFLGLLVIFPLLGHATWHLYRRALKQG